MVYSFCSLDYEEAKNDRTAAQSRADRSSFKRQETAQPPAQTWQPLASRNSGRTRPSGPRPSLRLAAVERERPPRTRLSKSTVWGGKRGQASTRSRSGRNAFKRQKATRRSAETRTIFAWHDATEWKESRPRSGLGTVRMAESSSAHVQISLGLLHATLAQKAGDFL